MPEAFAENRQWVVGMSHQGQGADELGAALAVRDILQGVQQLGVVGGVTLAIGIARRVDARRAAEEVHGQAGVVGQRRQAGDASGIARLEDGVLDERQAGFLRLDAGEFADRAHAHMLAEHGLEFLELAGVVAGEYEFFEQHHSSGKTSWLKVRVCGAASPICTWMLKVSISRWRSGNSAR